MNYSVPKESVQVRAVMTAGKPQAGTAFVAEAARDHAGHQRLEDMLNEPELFFPLVGRNRFTLLNKRNLLYLTTADAPELEYYNRLAHFARGERVHLHLRGRHTLTGTLLIEMPEGMDRVQDYLNSGRNFLPLLVRKELAIVNCASIVSLTLAKTPKSKPARQTRRTTKAN